MSKRYDADPDALAKYREFHRFDPKRVGPMKAGLRMPERMYLVGDAKWVTYRSDKTDPETLKRPKGTVDYIHEHDAGVKTYLPFKGVVATKGTTVVLPAQARDPDASLVRLGFCLGYKFELDGISTEAQSTRPYPELYCTADGKVLLVIQSKAELLAAMWGGALGVFARGIDG